MTKRVETQRVAGPAPRKIFVAVTGLPWHSFLTGHREVRAEVVFWRPSTKPFRALKEGELFLFKLRAPADAIVGGGVFARFAHMQLAEAWTTFGASLGAAGLDDLLRQIGRNRPGNAPSKNSEIGCIILRETFFFADDMWLPFRLPMGVQGGKSYEEGSEVGNWLVEQVARRAPSIAPSSLSPRA